MATTAEPTRESAHAGRKPAVVARMLAVWSCGRWLDQPVLITGSGHIIAGHGRVQAAQHFRLSQVPVLVIDHLPPAQRRAYVIADYKPAPNGLDDELLASDSATRAAISLEDEHEASSTLLLDARGLPRRPLVVATYNLCDCADNHQ
jgi:hypothetical protein